jgi:crotonobetainyl-CoA:carnitine CoA-transferase CaiB-like acyl-CoA transferase
LRSASTSADTYRYLSRVVDRTGEIDDGRAEPTLTIDSPVRIDQEQKIKPRPAPKLGEHTESVLKELGFDAAGLEALRAAGAIPPAGAESPAA